MCALLCAARQELDTPNGTGLAGEPNSGSQRRACGGLGGDQRAHPAAEEGELTLPKGSWLERTWRTAPADATAAVGPVILSVVLAAPRGRARRSSGACPPAWRLRGFAASSPAKRGTLPTDRSKRRPLRTNGLAAGRCVGSVLRAAARGLLTQLDAAPGLALRQVHRDVPIRGLDMLTFSCQS
jgi:hypothetical protein